MTANNYGVAYTGQDKICWYDCNSSSHDYSFYNGQLVFGIDNPGCGSLRAWSKYGHNWDSTTIRDIDISAGWVRIDSSRSTTRWEKASPGSNTVVPC
mgnify:CR=1 FL=1